jgi:FixJ family two-component response regulator
MPVNLYVAVVDDDESVRRSLSRLLQQAGMQPIGFASAEDLLADSLREHFRCLLVDVRLGGMSGIELQQRLIAQGVRKPIIYITSHDDPDAKAEALKTGGCAGYFRKTDAGPSIIEAIRCATAA